MCLSVLLAARPMLVRNTWHRTPPHHNHHNTLHIGKEEALLFGIFNSVGWYLGCAVGAVVGNHLYLADTAALLLGCSVSALAAVAILAALWKDIFRCHITIPGPFHAHTPILEHTLTFSLSTLLPVSCACTAFTSL